MTGVAQLAAKIVGYLIFAGSLGLKVPQIINIFSSKEVTGLSATALYSEVVLYITTLSYNILQKNPFSAYGEVVAIFIQNVTIMILYWIHAKPRVPPLTIVALMSIFAIIFMISSQLPDNLQPALVLINLPLVVSSKVPQIVQSYQSKSTGPMSLLSTFLSFAGIVTYIKIVINSPLYSLRESGHSQCLSCKYKEIIRMMQYFIYGIILWLS